MKTRTSIGGRVLALALLLWTFNAMPLFAAEAEHEEADVKVEIPKTLSAVWSAVIEHQTELHAVLATGKLEDVHHHAFAIRDLVAAMPGKSASLKAEQKATLRKSSTRVGSLAKLLDEAGDGGDSAKVASLVVKLDAELKTIEALYPEKTLMSVKKEADASKQMYVCPMHPDEMSDKPGKCPKCGMDLVLKKADTGSMPEHH